MYVRLEFEVCRGWMGFSTISVIIGFVEHIQTSSQYSKSASPNYTFLSSSSSIGYWHKIDANLAKARVLH